MNAVVRDVDPPISEADVLRTWKCLSAYRLKKARERSEILWVPGPRRAPFYRRSAVESFIRDVLEQPCRVPEKRPSLSLVDNGSPAKPDHHSCIDFGQNPDLEEHVAQVLARQI